MMLRQCKGCYEPKDLEGVQPVLNRCLYDGGDGGDVLCSGLCAEASADLELGFRWTEAFSLSLFVGGTAGFVRKGKESVQPYTYRFL